MKEFGSDFHFIEDYQSVRDQLTSVYHDAVLLADGRMCVVALIRQYQWNRLWMPEYFCYEVINSIAEQTGIKVVYYPDWPGSDDNKTVEGLPYREGDVLFRVNYFGTRDMRSNKNIPVPVIEDHSHDLIGSWARNSDADWCIASLRKSLPLPEGGMMWSPKGNRLNINVILTEENKEIAVTRWEAMRMKSGYLAGKTVDKETFRQIYMETEDWFDHGGLSLIDERSRKYITGFDINAWQGAKRRNWRLLRKLVKTETCLLESDLCAPFSFILMAESANARDRIRKNLIEHSVYPAILWNLPQTVKEEALDFSKRMLSIHCDGRYTEEDIIKLADIINDSF